MFTKKALLKVVFCCVVIVYNSSQLKAQLLKPQLTKHTIQSRLPKDSSTSEKEYKYAVSLLTHIYPSAEKQKQGIAILKNLIDNGNTSAGIFLANMYFKGIGVDKDEEKSIKILEKLAAKQHPEALFKIATFYNEGGYTGYTENKGKALEFYKRAAANGYSAAYASLGQLAEENNQYTEAVQWYKKGLLSKDLKSMTRLAHMYTTGKGLTLPNLDEAARIYYLILSSPNYEHSKFYSAYENFYTIGNKVQPINAGSFKNVLNKLFDAYPTHFKQLIGEDFEPIPWENNNADSGRKQFETYYRVNLNTGFKNARIVKRLIPTNINNTPKVDTAYSFQGEILFYAPPAKTKEAFIKWTELLHQIFGEVKGEVFNKNTTRPSLFMPVTNADGKKIILSLEVLGKKSDRLAFKME